MFAGAPPPPHPDLATFSAQEKPSSKDLLVKLIHVSSLEEWFGLCVLLCLELAMDHFLNHNKFSAFLVTMLCTPLQTKREGGAVWSNVVVLGSGFSEHSLFGGGSKGRT